MIEWTLEKYSMPEIVDGKVVWLRVGSNFRRFLLNLNMTAGQFPLQIIDDRIDDSNIID